MDKSLCIPDDVWSASFKCAVGTLPDGTIAKMPLKVPEMARSMNHEQFAHPETFAVKVAAMLRHFGCLTMDVCKDFGKYLDCAAARAEVILATDTSAMPGFAQPESSHWTHTAKVEPHELGATITSRYLQSAKEYAPGMWRRSFASLTLNDKALALYFCKAPDLLTPSTVAEEDNLKGSELKAAIGNINALCEKGHFTEEELQSGISELNRVVSGTRNPKRARLSVQEQK